MEILIHYNISTKEYEAPPFPQQLNHTNSNHSGQVLDLVISFCPQGVWQSDFGIIRSILYLTLLQSYITPVASQTQRCFFS
jgi:hypothetical protein